MLQAAYKVGSLGYMVAWINNNNSNSQETSLNKGQLLANGETQVILALKKDFALSYFRSSKFLVFCDACIFHDLLLKPVEIMVVIHLPCIYYAWLQRLYNHLLFIKNFLFTIISWDEILFDQSDS